MASLSWCYTTAVCGAGDKFDCSLCPSTSAVCRRRARSTRASLASLSWCYHRGLRCRGASLTAASVLRRRLSAVAVLARRERRWLLLAGAATALCVVQGCRCDCSLCPSTSAVCAVAACSLDASVAGLSKLVLPPCFARCRGASLTAASVLRRRLCAVAGLALDASVAGFYKLVLPSRRAWCRGAG